MNFKRFLAGIALVATCSLSEAAAVAAARTISANTFVGRSFSTNMATELMAEQAAWAMDSNNEGWHNTFQVIGQYNRNFKSNSATGIGAYPFWSGTNVMTVGSNVHGVATPFQCDAYQFGLGNVTTSGSVQLNPILYNAGADMLFYVGAHQTERGFWAKINAAVGVASVNPQLTEPLKNTGVVYTANQMVPASGAVTTPIFSTMTQAWAGGSLNQTYHISTFLGLQYGLINGKQTTGAKFGDIDFAVGYNFLANERSHLGVGVRFTAPTGNKPAGVYVLEPVWGNGGHFGLGGELFGHATLWESDNKSLQLWGDIQVQHLFKAKQMRSYDLIANGVGSKYILVADCGTAGGTTYLTDTLVQQLVNVSTLATNSTVGAVVDGALMLQYNCNNWQFDLGYNFAGKSKETLLITGTLPVGRYAALGHQDVATGGGTAQSNLVDPAFKMYQAAPAASETTGVAPSTATNIQGNAALNVNGVAGVNGAAQAAGWSSKVFGQVAYRWNDSKHTPSIALQGSGEFSTSGNNALNQWNIGLRGGLSF